ncbi:glycosyltransferase [Streptomyces sp. NPDC056161]|uniref:glycosyltransferase n=1 Tax=Streptomyces sp. NPDC056161 TaxID=3345732 RepID=UPI0035DCE22E
MAVNDTYESALRPPGGPATPGSGRRRHQVAVLLLTNEGFRQTEGGVARYVHNILAARDGAATSAEARGVELSWHVAERASCGGTDDAVFAAALRRHAPPGEVRYHSLADPRAHAWEVDHFEHCLALGASAAQVAITVAEDTDSVLVVSGMSMFAMTARFLMRAADQLGIDATYVHMTHNPVLRPGGDAELPETYADSVMGHLARSEPRVCVGWESFWMREQYQQVYGIPDDKFLFARAGVPTGADKFRRLRPDPGLLRSLGVPTDRDLVVSWGRGVAEKGFELLIDAAHRAGDALLPVVLNPFPNPALREHARDVGSPAVLLDGQDDQVLSALCQWPRTRCAAFLSEREAASVTPIEAALMSNGGGLVVVGVPAGVYPELIEHGATGLITESREPGAVADTLLAVRAMDDEARAEMSRTAHRRAVREHDFHTNWAHSFEELLDRHLAVIGLPGFAPAP